MHKVDAIDKFFKSFGLPAYDQNTVKSTIKLPYKTYDAPVSPGDEVSLTASIWYQGREWTEIRRKADEISTAIGICGKVIPVDDGYIWIKRGTPFAQPVGDENEKIRRIVLNIIVEYLTEN